MTDGLLSWMDRGEAKLPWRVDRAVDRFVATKVRAYEDVLRDIAGRAAVVVVKCSSCGVGATPFGMWHRPECELDRSITDQKRWQMRHPEAFRRRERIRRIKQRWAVINGRCAACFNHREDVSSKRCNTCRGKDQARYLARRERGAEAVAA